MTTGGAEGPPGGIADILPPLLVVEDDARAATVVAQLLTGLGLVNGIVTIGNGHTAIAWLDAHRKSGSGPALVLMDVDLPGCSGLTVLRWMRQEGGYADTPVVMLTGSSDLHNISDAYELGIASYLVKPVGFEAISEIVRALPLRWAIVDQAAG